MARSLADSIAKRMRMPLGMGDPPAQRRVLIVDDEPAVCEFVKRVLSHGGYAPAVATSGADALAQLAAQGPVDLIVTDLIMPQMSGDELARLVRRTEPGTKVLYLTGYSDRLFSEKAVLWEGEAYLDKPTTMGNLLEAVSLLLDGRVVARADTRRT